MQKNIQRRDTETPAEVIRALAWKREWYGVFVTGWTTYPTSMKLGEMVCGKGVFRSLDSNHEVEAFLSNFAETWFCHWMTHLLSMKSRCVGFLLHIEAEIQLIYTS